MRTRIGDLPDKSPGRISRLKTDSAYRKQLQKLYAKHTAQELADLLGVSDRTIRRHIAALKAQARSAA